MTNHIDPKETTCCGCTSCFNICPKHAITMQADKKGFQYPVIDESKCVDCGLCTKACPILEEQFNQKKEYKQKVYALVLKDRAVLKDSSSGGAFSALAIQIIQEGGIVCGAILDDEMFAKHTFVEKIEDLKKMRGSKYVQSDLQEVYRQIEQLLKENRKVMFTGTPCQVDGLNHYLSAKNQSTENLLTVDLLCHGVPSPKIWCDFVQYLEKNYHSKLIGFKFRTKIAGWENSVEEAAFENGKKIKNSHIIRTYLTLFYKNVSLRPMCFTCKYSSYDRCSDITIGDFWGIDKTCAQMNDNTGISVVLTNTAKGEHYICYADSVAELTEFDKESCAQRALQKNASSKCNQDIFWNEYVEHGFEFIANKYGKRSNLSLMKIKTITLLHKMHLLRFGKSLLNRLGK